MLRIFLILSLAVALAGVGFSFVLKDKVRGLSEERDTFRTERDTAQENERTAKTAEKKAKDAEKVAKDELTAVTAERDNKVTELNETQARLTKTATDLEGAISARDTAQRRLAQWDALSIRPDQIAALQADARRLQTERDAFAEEKKVMSREIARLGSELDVYRGVNTEVIMPDVRGLVTSVDGNYRFVIVDIGLDDGLKQNGKVIITRGQELVAKAQLVRLDSRTAVANLLPDWTAAEVKPGDRVMTSYEALAR